MKLLALIFLTTASFCSVRAHFYKEMAVVVSSTNGVVIAYDNEMPLICMATLEDFSRSGQIPCHESINRPILAELK